MENMQGNRYAFAHPSGTPCIRRSKVFFRVNMTGIGSGQHLLRVEIYELWSSGEKLNFTAKEITVQYVQQTKASRLVKIPTVKSGAGTDLTFVSSSAKIIFREIEQDQKQEAISKRDEW